MNFVAGGLRNALYTRVWARILRFIDEKSAVELRNESLKVYFNVFCLLTDIEMQVTLTFRLES